MNHFRIGRKKILSILQLHIYVKFTMIEHRTCLPSRISMVIERETTSREAKSFALGAYRSMKRSPSELMRKPPSPREPSVIRQPAP